MAIKIKAFQVRWSEHPRKFEISYLKGFAIKTQRQATGLQ